MFSNSTSLLSHIHCKYAIIIPSMAFKTTASGNPELTVVLAESSAGAVSFIGFQVSQLTTLTTRDNFLYHSSFKSLLVPKGDQISAGDLPIAPRVLCCNGGQLAPLSSGVMFHLGDIVEIDVTRTSPVAQCRLDSPLTAMASPPHCGTWVR